MRKIRAIVVDDEPLLIQTFQAILNEFCRQVEVVEIATDAFDAKIKIEMYKPDVVFLDINMPKVNGFDLLKSIDNRDFEVIFITAYDNYAVDALREGALDYILKPVLSDDVINSVKRLEKALAFKSEDKKEQDVALPANVNQAQKIVVQNNNTYLFLEHKDIVWLEADHNYTKIYLVNKKVISSAKPIKHYESLLPQAIFFRIHKSYIINTSYIKEYLRDSKGPLVVMSSDEKLRVAQPKQSAFRKFMIMNRHDKQ